MSASALSGTPAAGFLGSMGMGMGMGAGAAAQQRRTPSHLLSRHGTGFGICCAAGMGQCTSAQCVWNLQSSENLCRGGNCDLSRDSGQKRKI